MKLLCSLLLISFCSVVYTYRPNARSLGYPRGPPVLINNWSGPYFNEEEQKGAFNSLLHHGAENGNKRFNPHHSDSLGFDPNKLFNPEVERPQRRRGPSGLEAETYVGDMPQAAQEDMVSPQERLAHLVSKPIIEESEPDKMENNERHFVGRKRQPYDKQRHFIDGYAPDRNTNFHRFEKERNFFDRENMARRKYREERGRRRSYYQHQMKPQFIPAHRRQNPEELESRKLFDQIRNFIKRSKVPKASKPGIIKRLKKSKITRKLRKKQKKRTLSKSHKTVSNKKNDKRSKMAATTKKNKKVTTRNQIDNLVTGTSSENFGSQFSEPYRGNQNSGNNGYTRGEYFGQDAPDVQDSHLRASLRDAYSNEEAGPNRHHGNQLVKSFNTRPVSGQSRSYLLDTEDFDGFGGNNDGHDEHHGATVHAETEPVENSQSHAIMTLQNDMYNSDVELMESASEHQIPHSLPHNGIGLPFQDSVPLHSQPGGAGHGGGIMADHLNSFFGAPREVDHVSKFKGGVHEGHLNGEHIMNHGVFSPEPVYIPPSHHEMTPEQYGKHLDTVMTHFLPKSQAHDTGSGTSEFFGNMAHGVAVAEPHHEEEHHPADVKGVYPTISISPSEKESSTKNISPKRKEKKVVAKLQKEKKTKPITRKKLREVKADKKEKKPESVSSTDSRPELKALLSELKSLKAQVTKLTEEKNASKKHEESSTGEGRKITKQVKVTKLITPEEADTTKTAEDAYANLGFVQL